MSRKNIALEFRGGNSNDYTVADLKILAKRKNITGYSKLKKAELCEVLKIKPAPVNNLSHPSRNAVQLPNKGGSPRKTILVYKDCDYKNLVFPCKIKRGFFANKSDWDDYVKLKRLTFTKTRQNRADVIKLANIELKNEKESLKNKKKSTPKIKFAI